MPGARDLVQVELQIEIARHGALHQPGEWLGLRGRCVARDVSQVVDHPLARLGHALQVRQQQARRPRRGDSARRVGDGARIGLVPFRRRAHARRSPDRADDRAARRAPCTAGACPRPVPIARRSSSGRTALPRRMSAQHLDGDPAHVRARVAKPPLGERAIGVGQRSAARPRMRSACTRTSSSRSRAAARSRSRRQRAEPATGSRAQCALCSGVAERRSTRRRTASMTAGPRDPPARSSPAGARSRSRAPDR